MNASTRSTQSDRTAWLLVPLLAAALTLAGCSGESGDDTSSQRPQQSQQPAPSGQMGAQSLSAADVTDEQIQTAARIAMSIRMGTQQDRMRMQKEMKAKYGNPQEMDSTEKREARKEMRRRQRKMRKKQMEILQKEAKAEGMDPQTFRSITRAARQDTTLRNRLQAAMKAQMKKQMQERLQQRQGQQGQ
jgi:hypothetical protein